MAQNVEYGACCSTEKVTQEKYKKTRDDYQRASWMYICLRCLRLFQQVLLQLKQRKSTRSGGRRSRYLSSSAIGCSLLPEHCAVQLSKEEASPLLVRPVSRKAPVWAKVPNSVPSVSGNKRLFQESQWGNVNFWFEPIPKDEVGSSYLEVRGFT